MRNAGADRPVRRIVVVRVGGAMKSLVTAAALAFAANAVFADPRPADRVYTADQNTNNVSVIDPATFKATRRIETANGPGMVLFHPQRKIAFVVSSFTPEVDVVDVASHRVVKRIPVASPFSPFLQFTPDHKEVWMTHKDVGKVTRIDTD